MKDSENKSHKNQVELFNPISDKELPKYGHLDFSHIGWEGTDFDSLEIRADGFWNAAQVIYDRMDKPKEDDSTIAFVDSLFYPFCFLFRHFLELYLKSIFFKFTSDMEEKKNFMNEHRHNLVALWKVVKPILSKGKKHVGSSVNIGDIENYIVQFNAFDRDSMTMRYPMDKKLHPHLKDQMRIDFRALYSKMNELYYNLHQISLDISGQAEEMASDEEMQAFWEVFNHIKPDLYAFLECITPSTDSNSDENHNEFGIKSIDELSFDEPSHWQFLRRCYPDTLVLLESSCLAAREVLFKHTKLSKQPKEAQREFVALINFMMHHFNLKFGDEPDFNKLKLLSLPYDTVLANINFALSIITNPLEA